MFSARKPLSAEPVFFSRVVSVCFDCLNMYENAELSDDAEPGTNPLSKLDASASLGLLPCAHGYDCGSCDGPSASEYFGERCDTCHTRYAGARFDYELVGE